MDTGDDPRLEALTEALRRLEQRQQAMEHRLSRLEGAGASGTPHPGHKIAATPPPQAEGQSNSGLETRLGLTLINRIGALTLVLGVAFFFRHAVENRWIGEGARVALGLAAGLAGVAVADRLWRGGQRIYAQGVSGAGIAILYVSFYASAGWYRVLDAGTAFSGMVLATLAAGALSIRYGSLAIAVLAMAGGYLTPVVLHTGRDRPWFLLGYLLLLAAGAAAIGRPRRWRTLEVLAFFATFALFLTQSSFPARPGRHTVLTVFALLYGGLFTGTAGRVVAVLAQLAATAWIWGIWSEMVAGAWQQAGFILLAAALAGLQITLSAELRKPLPAAGVAAAMLAMTVPAVFSGYQLTLAWALLALFLAWAAAGAAHLRLGDAAAAILLLVLVRLYGWDANAADPQRWLTFGLAAAAFWGAASWMRGWRAPAAYIAGHFHLLWILGLEVREWSRRTASPENLRSVENASVSILMAAYALALIALGLATRLTANRLLGLALMGVVIGKLYAYDVWQLSRIYRFIAFAVLGALLLAASYLYSYYRSRPGPTGRRFWLELKNRKV